MSKQNIKRILVSSIGKISLGPAYIQDLEEFSLQLCTIVLLKKRMLVAAVAAVKVNYTI